MKKIFIILISVLLPNFALADWTSPPPSIIVPYTFTYQFDSNALLQCEAGADPETASYWQMEVTAEIETIVYTATTSDLSIPQSLSYNLVDEGVYKVRVGCYVDAYGDLVDVGQYYFLGSSYAEPSYHAFLQSSVSPSASSSSSTAIDLIAGSSVAFLELTSFVLGLILTVWIFKLFIA